MHIEDIRKRLQEVQARAGGWTTDNIRLAPEVYTRGLPRRNELGMPYTGQELVDPRARSFVQIASDLLGQPLQGLHVLDLAPGEGLFAAEFSLHGAHVVALEPEEFKQERLRFLEEALELSDFEIREDDFRTVQADQLDQFDVVLCAGVLDQLDSATFFPVMQQVVAACRRLALIDTHVSLADPEAYVHQGQIYWGRTLTPPAELNATEAESPPFWLTRPSVCNLLRHVGFTSVLECHNPMGFVFADRHVFAAMKGTRQTIQTMPLLNEPEEDWPERIQLSAPPRENADIYQTHEDLVVSYHHYKAEYEALLERHGPFTYLGGTLRQLPRMFWQAIRNRFGRRTEINSQC